MKKKVKIGAWFQVPCYEFNKIISETKNIDFIVYDLEHGNLITKDLISLIDISKFNKKNTYVRLSSIDSNEAVKALEYGADGLILPNIISYKQLTNFLTKVLFGKNYNRGVGFCHANQYGKNLKKYLTFKPKIFPMVENKFILNDLDLILKNKHISGLFVGPYDLSLSIGKLGSFNNNHFNNVITKVIQKCNSNKKYAGIHCVDLDKKILLNNKKKGFNFIAYGMDTELFKLYAKILKK